MAMLLLVLVLCNARAFVHPVHHQSPSYSGLQECEQKMQENDSRVCSASACLEMSSTDEF